jgi:hypothetical protein
MARTAIQYGRTITKGEPMSRWKELDIENKVTKILRDAPNVLKGHHLGQPFLTAYQIAIEFSLRYPKETAIIGFPVGGVGTKRKNSLAQYIARELSRRINPRVRSINRITHIEGGFLSNQHLHDINFEVTGPEELIHSSLTNTNFTLSMFRLKDND